MSERFPAIPMPTGTLESQRATLLALKEAMEMLTGQRGTDASRSASASSLVSALTSGLDTKVSKAGDTMTGLLTLSGDPSAALHAATKQYTDAGDRFVEIASIAPTAGVASLDVNWTAGAYRAVKVILAGIQAQGPNNSECYVQVRRAGTLINGGTDYHSNRVWWWASTGNAVYLNTNAYYISAGGAAAGVPVASEFLITDPTASGGGRINCFGLTAYTLWSPSLNYASCFGTAEVLVGTGQLSGFRVGFSSGATTFTAVGRIIVLGIKS